ncbi:MAG: winged helix-turn-helix domain-containing protein [Spirochaetes bacterium]|nr:winged helix-turn-helix domain-containing protein [Spirochaetota bacterium]
MKPQDVVVLGKILVMEGRRVPIAELASSIGLSASETHAAIKRCEKSGLLLPDERRVQRSGLQEFLFHGLKYAFPAETGPPDRGIPTAHSAPPLAHKIISGAGDVFVWPFAKGTSTGTSVVPLYPSVPAAALGDQLLYEFLALVDALRLGRVRERKMAEEELAKMIRGGGDS